MLKRKKSAGKKKRKRKIPRLRWLLLGLAAAAVLFWFFPVDVSHLPPVRKKLQAWRHLGITVEHVTLTPRGRFQFYGVRLGAPPACGLGELDLNLSWIALAKGRIAVRSAEGKEIQIHWDRLESFIHSLQKQNSLRLLAGRMRLPSFQGRDLEILGWIPRRSLRLDRADFAMQWNPAFHIDVQAEGLSDSGDVRIEAISFRFAGDPAHFTLTNVKAALDETSLTGRAACDAAGEVEGEAAFQNLDLGRWSKSRLAADQILQGKAQGEVAFRGELGDPDALEASGTLSGSALRLANFPFQKDALIRNYLPALQDVTFREFRVARWRLHGRKFFLDSLAASGSPLSVDGAGRVTVLKNSSGPDSLELRGGVWFDLIGHLQEDYFRTLSPLVRGTLYRDTTGAPTFKFRVEGDFKKQNVALEKLFSRLLKSLTSRFGGKVKSEFQPAAN